MRQTLFNCAVEQSHGAGYVTLADQAKCLRFFCVIRNLRNIAKTTADSHSVVNWVPQSIPYTGQANTGVYAYNRPFVSPLHSENRGASCSGNDNWDAVWGAVRSLQEKQIRICQRRSRQIPDSSLCLFFACCSSGFS